MTIKIPTPNTPDHFFVALWQECLERIARGSTRDVYAIPGHDDKVLKVVSRPGYFTNWSEIVTYKFATEKKYLAEVISWSSSGKFLVMERLSPVTLVDLAGHEIPAYLNDKKPENFGRAKSGEIKALDYGMLDLPTGHLYTFPKPQT